MNFDILTNSLANGLPNERRFTPRDAGKALVLAGSGGFLLKGISDLTHGDDSYERESHYEYTEIDGGANKNDESGQNNLADAAPEFGISLLLGLLAYKLFKK